MNTQDVGGGEILDHIGNNTKIVPDLDEQLIRLFGMVPYIKVLICILIVLITVYVVLRMFNINSPFKGKGIKSELNHIDAVKKRDASIIRANKFMSWATKFIERTPLAMDKASKDYWQYNITRAGIKIPGGYRTMKAVEFHSLVHIAALFSLVLSVITTLLINSILGWVLILLTIILVNTIPMIVLRSIVKTKDTEIKSNFSDFYLMIHYVLIAETSTPLSGIMKSYDKTTTSLEMHRFIDVCIHYIDTYGEYEAARYIAKDYRELHEVGKLMRLIRQANEGGDIKEELEGFRSELISEQKYNIEKRMDKLVGKAKASFNILMIVLVQAILSAMSIYISDLGLVKGLLGQ